MHSEYLGLVFVCQSLILQNTLVNIWKASGMNAPAPSREGWERMAKLQELQKAGTKENRMGEREEKKNLFRTKHIRNPKMSRKLVLEEKKKSSTGKKNKNNCFKKNYEN